MKVCLMQLRVGDEDSARRRQAAEQAVQSLAGSGVELLMLPELWATGFSHVSRYAVEAERPMGATAAQAKRWAQTLSCGVLSGSFVERGVEGALRNTMLLFDRTGAVRGRYAKIHLFGYESRERALLTPGTALAVPELEGFALGLATCYDLRFPEQFRRMVEAGAQLFAVCAAWPMARLEDWQLLCRVRALENQCWLLACNHCGTHAGVTGAGHSMVVAPDGTVLAEAGEQEQLLTAEIDLDAVSRWRAQFPALQDRVPL